TGWLFPSLDGKPVCRERSPLRSSCAKSFHATAPNPLINPKHLLTSKARGNDSEEHTTHERWRRIRRKRPSAKRRTFPFALSKNQYVRHARNTPRRYGNSNAQSLRGLADYATDDYVPFAI